MKAEVEDFLRAALTNIEQAERVGAATLSPDERVLLQKAKPLLKSVVGSRARVRKAQSLTSPMFGRGVDGNVNTL